MKDKVAKNLTQGMVKSQVCNLHSCRAGGGGMSCTQTGLTLGLIFCCSDVESLYVPCLAAQSCPTLWDTMDRSPSGTSVHGDSPGKNTGVGCHALVQGFFPTQESNPGLLHCRRILYQLSYQGRPFSPVLI